MKTRSPRGSLLFAGSILATLIATSAHAGTYTFITPSGSTESGGNPVDAEVTFTTSAGGLTITLTNLESNPTTVAQNLSDLSFTISGGSLTGATLSGSSAQEITVNSDGTFSLGGTVATGWVPTLSGTSGHLDDLVGTGHAGPAHTIIGPPDGSSLYSNANNSIAGNGPHNPFLNQTASFTITGVDLSEHTIVTGAIFSFGTTSGNNVTGQMVPEPSSLVLGLLGLGLAGSVGLYRRRRRS